MDWVERVPGLQPGNWGRNLAVVAGCLLVLPIVALLLPIVAIVLVAGNYRGIADRLSLLPGVTADGGFQAGIAAGVYVLVCWGVLLAGLSAGISGPGFADDAEADAGGDEQDLSEDEILTLFETIMSQSGVDVESIEREGDVLAVAYYPDKPIEGDVPDGADNETLEEMGYVAGGYVGAIDDGLTTERMEVTVLDPETDEPTAYWTVETEWAREYHAGEISMNDVADRAFETFERADES